MLKKIILITLVSLLLTACQPKENIREIYVPNIKLEIADNPYEEGNQPWIFDSIQTRQWFSKLLKDTGIEIKVNFSPALDSDYFVWDYDNAILFLKEYRKSVWSVEYKSQSRDCEDYAFDFKNWVQFNYANTFKEEASVPISIIFVRQINEFANVPAGGNHALIGVATNKGVLIYEPQNGEYVLLDEYPNKLYIYYIIR